MINSPSIPTSPKLTRDDEPSTPSTTDHQPVTADGPALDPSTNPDPDNPSTSRCLEAYGDTRTDVDYRCHLLADHDGLHQDERYRWELTDRGVVAHRRPYLEEDDPQQPIYVVRDHCLNCNEPLVEHPGTHQLSHANGSRTCHGAARTGRAIEHTRTADEPDALRAQIAEFTENGRFIKPQVAARSWDKLVTAICNIRGDKTLWLSWEKFFEADERGPCDEVMIEFVLAGLAAGIAPQPDELATVTATLLDAGIDPDRHGGVTGAVLLLVGLWREAKDLVQP